VNLRRLLGLFLALSLFSPLSAAAQTPVPVESTPTPEASSTATLASSATPLPAASPTATPTAMPTIETTPSVTPTATPVPGCLEDEADLEQDDGVTFQEVFEEVWGYSGAGDGPRNIVKLKNKRSGELRVRGNVQLNRIQADSVGPFNYAIAYSACGVQSQTLAVALQVNLYGQDASYVAPENFAVAVNYGCQRCAAVAHAIQFSFPVADPRETPEEVRTLTQELDRELRAIHAEQSALTLVAAEARVSAVLDRFRSLPALINEARDARDAS
jgi:hypothetical protein